jgi:hypothetical protein
MNEEPVPYTCKHGCERDNLKDIILTQARRAEEITRPLLDALETQAAEIERLRAALQGIIEFGEDNPERGFICAKFGHAALRETE